MRKEPIIVNVYLWGDMPIIANTFKNMNFLSFFPTFIC